MPNNVRLEVVIAAAYGPLFVLGITLSLPFALLVGRLSYTRKVRPLLAARPPWSPGAPPRCRVCGADLALANDAFVMCRFCRTSNVVGSEAATEIKRRLDEEVAGYHARASGMVSATSQASTRMTRTLIVCFALVYVGLIAFGVAAGAVVKSIG